MRRLGLAWRIALLVVLACVVTAAIGLVISISLINPTNDGTARANLSRLADLAAAQGGVGDRPAARRILAGLRIRSASIDADGRVLSESAAVRAAVGPQVVTSVLAGKPVSTTTQLGGGSALVEARPVGTGGIVLIERHADAVAAGVADVRRTVWALLIAVALTGTLGVVFGRRLVRPLRETAAAAHALAQGRRDVAVRTGGPPEVAEVAAALNALVAALGHSEARQREFLLSVSHDLRTPLTAILGYAESLRTGVAPPELTGEFAAGIEGEAYRLDRMVGDLLDLARLDADDVRIEPADVDLAQVVRAAAPTWDLRCTTAGVRFVLEVGLDPAPVVTDPARLRQMLDGLFDNALRVTPAGQVIVLGLYRDAATPAPMATAGPGAHAAVLEVRDGGPGLTDQDLGVAFDRGALYERYRGVRQVGTGLGLAIVARLAARLGIGLRAGHAPEGGARFSLRVTLSR